MKYLKLIRFQNLLILAFMQYLFRYTYMQKATFTNLIASHQFLALSHFQFFLLVLATLLIAAAGYIINNIMDQGTDEIAKKRIVGKSIAEGTAYNLYFILNITGVAIGFYLANAIGRPSFATLFIFIAALLYFYATTLKQIAVVGNVVVAFVLSLSILILGIFDLVPAVVTGNEYWQGNQQQLQTVFITLRNYAIFAFIINFIREMVKDVEDYDADYASGITTLPVLFGKKRTLKLIFALSFIPIGILIYYLNKNEVTQYLQYYMLLFVLAPLLFFTLKIWNSHSQKEISQLSLLLKTTLFLGILSILVLTYTNQNA